MMMFCDNSFKDGSLFHGRLVIRLLAWALSLTTIFKLGATGPRDGSVGAARSLVDFTSLAAESVHMASIFCLM
jgi:hypothetical protein